jgi:hypothetical protein|tara:strand:- start:498 stop:671 length:174 start_codon:yes stop_codon:yes gene_type:complete
MQVKSLKIPFHKWYKWLESRFVSLKEVHEKEKEIKQLELKLYEESVALQREKEKEKP